MIDHGLTPSELKQLATHLKKLMDREVKPINKNAGLCSEIVEYTHAQFRKATAIHRLVDISNYPNFSGNVTFPLMVSKPKYFQFTHNKARKQYDYAHQKGAMWITDHEDEFISAYAKERFALVRWVYGVLTGMVFLEGNESQVREI